MWRYPKIEISQTSESLHKQYSFNKRNMIFHSDSHSEGRTLSCNILKQVPGICFTKSETG